MWLIILLNNIEDLKALRVRKETVVKALGKLMEEMSARLERVKAQKGNLREDAEKWRKQLKVVTIFKLVIFLWVY